MKGHVEFDEYSTLVLHPYYVWT